MSKVSNIIQYAIIDLKKLLIILIILSIISYILIYEREHNYNKGECSLSLFLSNNQLTYKKNTIFTAKSFLNLTQLLKKVLFMNIKIISI